MQTVSFDFRKCDEARTATYRWDERSRAWVLVHVGGYVPPPEPRIIQ